MSVVVGAKEFWVANTGAYAAIHLFFPPQFSNGATGLMADFLFSISPVSGPSLQAILGPCLSRPTEKQQPSRLTIVQSPRRKLLAFAG